MEIRVTGIVKNLGMYLVVEFERELIDKDGEGYFIETGTRIVGNQDKKYYDESWDWNRFDRKMWHEESGDYWDRKYEQGLKFVKKK